MASSTGLSPKSTSSSAQASTVWCPSPPLTASRKRERSLRRRASKAGPAPATTSRTNGPSNTWCCGPLVAHSNTTSVRRSAHPQPARGFERVEVLTGRDLSRLDHKLDLYAALRCG